jgi:hypothetical protein
MKKIVLITIALLSCFCVVPSIPTVHAAGEMHKEFDVCTCEMGAGYSVEEVLENRDMLLQDVWYQYGSWYSHLDSTAVVLSHSLSVDQLRPGSGIICVHLSVMFRHTSFGR